MRKTLVIIPLVALVLAWPIVSDWSANDSLDIRAQPTLDFGDAEYLESWGGYPTLLAQNGARHVIGGPWLGGAGDAPDGELDGQPEATALGDDNLDGNDDEDGVTIPTLFPGYTSNIQLEVNGGGGVVEAWVDFNDDHQWQHPAERVFAGYLPDGVHTIPVTTTSSASTGQTCARFRVSTTGGLSPAGEAADGEVEDHAVSIEDPTWDFGDAPDGVGAALYPTLLVHNGARHLIRGPWLGDVRDNPDSEVDGQPQADGLGDDNNGGDDEDGVQIPPLIPGNPADVSFQVSGGGGYVDGWIDFDNDETWQHPGERVVSGLFADGMHTIPLLVPDDAEYGQTFARFRISASGGLPPDGPAGYGEVEDYEVAINYKWEQPPDLDTTGIAVSFFNEGGITCGFEAVADDYECRQPGYISEVRFWTAYKNDLYLSFIEKFTLRVFSNLPDSLSPSGFAQPDSQLWIGYFPYYEYDINVWAPDIREGWYEGNSHQFPADTVCYQVTIPIPPEESFYQTGTPESPQTYWLAICAADLHYIDDYGWKASYEHWNAPAVHGCAWGGPCEWDGQLFYPPTHELSGQQMDMAFQIISDPGLEFDYGDAPDDPEFGGYPTLYANGGARHVIGGPWLGAMADNPDGELDGQPDTQALGDNTHDQNDENGVQIPVLYLGQDADVVVEVNGGGGFVQGWIDYNQDQAWDASEMVIAQSLPDGTDTLKISVPDTAITGTSFARFRISSVGDLDPGDRAEDGEVEDYEVTIQDPATGVQEGSIPKRFELYQSAPNPFNPTAVIRYDVPAGGGRITLRVYDVAGRLVRTLVDGVESAGEKRVTWDGRNGHGSRVATGVYFYRMTAPGFVKTKKMVLLQ
jgi:hypothetical protein